MFSYFANHSQNTPIGSISIQELHHLLVNPDREPFKSTVNIIQLLRSEPDEAEQKKIKGKLIAFTPGAQLDTKEKNAMPEQKNIHYSGFMQIDIDLKENPNMTNAEAIRDKLAQIPYIALSALSARGKGVWGLMALAEPEKFTLYTDQVSEYFRGARVTIDKSKSKNPTELRYFAPDPGAILKTEYKLFPLIQPLFKPGPKPSTRIAHTHQSYSSLSDLQRWVTETTRYTLTDGQKHYYIFWLSYALRKNGSSETEVYNTIHSHILSSDQIKSNCISGGIAYANAKGIYTPNHTPSSQIVHTKVLQPASNPLEVLKQVVIIEKLPNNYNSRYSIGTDGLLYMNWLY